jgi:hypothetical protein
VVRRRILNGFGRFTGEHTPVSRQTWKIGRSSLSGSPFVDMLEFCEHGGMRGEYTAVATVRSAIEGITFTTLPASAEGFPRFSPVAFVVTAASTAGAGDLADLRGVRCDLPGARRGDGRYGAETDEVPNG